MVDFEVYTKDVFFHVCLILVTYMLPEAFTFIDFACCLLFLN